MPAQAQQLTIPPDESAPETETELPSPQPVPATPVAAAVESNAVRLTGLNKTTARSSTLEAPLGTVVRFGNLEIIAHRCWQAPPGERPENAALLEIRELKSDDAPKSVFQGWMFSSSPSLSSLEHPVYDIAVQACEHIELNQ